MNVVPRVEQLKLGIHIYLACWFTPVLELQQLLHELSTGKIIEVFFFFFFSFQV